MPPSFKHQSRCVSRFDHHAHERTLIGPCTTTIRGIQSEVLLEPSEDPVPRASAVNLDSVESVSLGTLVERLGRLSDERMRQICDALEVAVPCEA
jgi:mRNA interferase MazF